jgi:hypothetical protein
MSTLKPLLTSVSLMVLFAGCGFDGSSTVKGRVTDRAGVQTQELRRDGDTYGGTGTVSEATTIKLSRIGANGALEVASTATVKAGGQYEISAPAGEKKLICQAFDASGKVVASAIVESTGKANETVVVAPMDTESSVEAEVLVEMVAQGTTVAEANAIDLRARINAHVATEVRSVATAGGEGKAKIKALAEAVIAAQRTQVRSYSQAGVTITQATLFDAQLQAAQQLNTALDSEVKTSSQAYADFFVALDAAAEAAGVHASERAQAESAAGASFRGTIRVRSRTPGASDPVAEAAIRAAASLEARSSAVAVEAILRSGGAAQAVLTSVTTAGTELRQQASASTTASATAQAFADFRTSISGSASVSSSVLGNFLAVDVATQVTAQAAVAASVTAAAALDTATNAALAATLESASSIDFNALSTQVVNAYATYATTVRAQATALAIFGAKAQPTLDVLIVAHGSLRAGG